MPKLIMKQSMIGATFDLAAGDEYECDVATARRLIATGTAKLGPYEPPLAKGSKSEEELASVRVVETTKIIHDADGLETRCETRPVTKPKPGQRFRLPKIVGPGGRLVRGGEMDDDDD